MCHLYSIILLNANIVSHLSDYPLRLHILNPISIQTYFCLLPKITSFLQTENVCQRWLLSLLDHQQQQKTIRNGEINQKERFIFRKQAIS